MGDSERSKMYKETQSSIIKILEKGRSIDRNIYMNQLVLIKRDITSKDEIVRKSSLDMLDFLLSLNIEDIQTEVVKILHDTTVNKFIQNCVLKSIKKKIIYTISEDKFDFAEILAPWKNQNINKLTNIIEDVCLNDLPRNKCKNFFINHVIPTMMSITTNAEIRDTLTDMAFMLSTIVPISDLTAEELNMFLKDVNSKYVKSIGELRDQNYPNWHNLWIFLVRFCDKNIHCSMDLTNRLLRVVEYAFRNSSIQQRLKGYDCWKELIDNASLDMDHMCSPKQIKLLVTPLKAKFSKQEVVICKRFDVFVYLLEKLQHKAVLCLTEFLEFCYGPIGDSKDISKTGQGKSVPEIWRKSTQVLVELIGHSHGKVISCLSTEDVIKLEKPVINYSNISIYYKVIINSIGECCALLKEIDIESKRETVIKCMWKSVFNLVIPTPEADKKRYFQVISKVLDDYIQQSRENPYFEELLILIFTVLMSYDVEYIYEVVHHILKPLLIIIFTVDNFPVSVADKFKLVVAHIFSKILLVESKLKAIKEVMVAFMRLQPNEENATHICKIWLCVADELISDLTAKQIEEFVEFNDFFMWPAYNLHNLEESTKKQTVLHWMKLYRKMSMDSENKKLSVMKDLEKIFKNNPLLSSDVVSLLNVMSQFETKFTKEFVVKLMEVSSLILLLPNLKTDDEQKITAIVMQYFEPSLQCYKCEGNDDVIKNICNCIKHILCIHKGYKLLDTLADFIKSSPDPLKSKFSLHLSGLLLDLFNKESDIKSYNAKELQKALRVFKVENDNKSNTPATFIPPGGRSARIAKLAKNSPRSPQTKSKKVDSAVTSLRLFGKDVETLSPLSVKGSQLKNATPNKSRKVVNTAKRKMINSPSINDEKSIDFVPIDTEVKFQPEKLSSHQREVLRKRREDIPALYQDLSQSLSQDMFNSNSSSLKELGKDQEHLRDNRKVIVEVIGHQFKDVFEKEQKDDIPFHVASEVVIDTPQPIIEDIKVPEALEYIVRSETDLFPVAGADSDNVRQEVSEEIKIEENKENNGVVDSLNIQKESSNEQCTELEDKKTHDQQTPLEVKSGENNIEKSKENNEVINSLDIQKENSNENSVKDTENHEQQTPLVKSDDENEKNKKTKKLKAEFQKRELQKLRMDIVGADTFLSASSRRTRTREKSKKVEETSGKNSKVSPKEETSIPPQNLRKSLNVEKPEAKMEKNRRKTIGEIKDIRNEKESDPNNITIEGEKSISLLEIPVESKQKTEPDTPKTPRRRSTKSRVEHNKLTSEKMGQKQSEKKDSRSSRKSKNQPNKFDSKEADVKENEEKKGQKRKHSSCDLDSEDIIESSQESHADVTPVFNCSKKRIVTGISFEEKMDKSEGKTMIHAYVAPVDLAKEESRTGIDIQEKLDASKEIALVQETLTTGDFVPNIESRVEEVKENCATFIEEEIKSYAVVEAVINDNIEGIPMHIEEVAAEVEVTDTVVEVEVADTVVEVEVADTVAEVEGTDTATGNTNMNLIGRKVDSTEKIQSELNASQDSTLTHVSTQDLTQDSTTDISHDVLQTELLIENQTKEHDTQTQDTETQLTQSQDTQIQDTPTPSEGCTSSEENRPPVLYFDLPKKPELTESERMMCHMDTMSICSDPNNVTLKNSAEHPQSTEELEFRAGSPYGALNGLIMEDILVTPVSHSSQSTNSIPSSPVTVETPTRTTELLNDTFDISPIYSKSSSSSSDGEIPEGTCVPISLTFKADMEELDRIEKEVIPETQLENNTEGSNGNNEESENQANIAEELNENDCIPNLLGDIFKPFEAITNNDEEIICDLEEVPHQQEIVGGVKETSQVEEIPHQVEEVPHQMEEIPLRMEESPQENEVAVNQTDDTPNHVEVKPAKENNGFHERSSKLHERASKLLNMVNVNSPTVPKIFIRKRVGGRSMSPSAARIKRLMSNFDQKKCTEDFGGEVKEEDILTFTREVPSPLAVPRSSILKRKFSDTSDPEGISPCPKRKRVNFSDPCLTSKKLFIKDDYHQERPELDAKCLFHVSPEPKAKEEHLREIFDPPGEPASSERLTETENIETEPSLEIVNSVILRKDKPIYPKLIDCKDDVMLILKKVTSPMFIATLMNKLKNKDIKTIGDLAKQSETEINRFPFKVPVVANVYRALDTYYKRNVDRNGKGLENVDPVKVNGVEEGENKKNSTHRRIVPTKVVDLKTEFKVILEKSKKEGSLDDLAKILLSSLEQSKLISLVKAQYKIDARDLIEESDFKVVIKHITQHMGLPDIFKILTESVENSEDESVYFDCMIKHSIDKKSLVNLLENRSLEDIKRGLEECISRNMFTKKDILDSCLFALIENPTDISSYINSISVVQLGNIVINRLETTDLKEFFRQIEKAHTSGKDRMISFNNETFKNTNDTSDILNNFKTFVDAQNEEQQNEVMVEMFKFISGKLKLNTLLELHVNFLKRIPSMVADNEEK